jgi:hypothetical protein
MLILTYIYLSVYLISYLFFNLFAISQSNCRLESILKKSYADQDIRRILWGLSFKNLIQLIEWYSCKNWLKYFYTRLQVISFIWVPVSKPVDVFLFIPTHATCTAHLIHTFAVQYERWNYLSRYFLLLLSPY